MKPRNCNECKYTKTCKSFYGSIGCVYNQKVVLAMILVLTFGIVALSFNAKAEELKEDEAIVIDSEDIGIKTMETEVSEDEVMVIEAESEILDAEPVYEEEVEYEEPETDHEIQEEEPEPEETESKEEEVESPEPPEGMAEGYVEGTYFEPNTSDSETGEVSYTCPDDAHEYAHSVHMDEDTYIYEEWCTVCGHGTEKPISDEEFEKLGVETDVEF